MKYKLIVLSFFSLLLFGACSTKAMNETISKPSAKVQSLITKHNLDVVNFKYTKEAIKSGTRNKARALLIDSRPSAKYLKSTIPSSINIPDTKFEEYFAQIKNLNKNKELIVFCGGLKCAKSPKVAVMLIKKGFKNVKLYQAGEPEWIKKSYKEVSLLVIKKAQAINSAFIIDARPYKMFLKETIPGSVSIPDTKMSELEGRFPSSKNEKIIIYCGGYNCGKSHNIANKLISLEYKNVAVYAAGIPDWKKAKLSTTASSKKTISSLKNVAKFSKNGVKIGLDEGTVDGDWFKLLIISNKIPSYIKIVDVTSIEEFAIGHLKGAINIQADKLSAKELYSKLPKDKTIIFNCTAGGRSLESWMKLNDASLDVNEIFYFDANIDCKNNNCKIEVNEPLG